MIVRRKTLPRQKQILDIGETTTLHNGDTIELLEDKYSFTVVFENHFNAVPLQYKMVPMLQFLANNKETTSIAEKLPKLTEESLIGFSSPAIVEEGKKLLESSIFNVEYDDVIYVQFGTKKIEFHVIFEEISVFVLLFNVFSKRLVLVTNLLSIIYVLTLPPLCCIFRKIHPVLFLL